MDSKRSGSSRREIVAGRVATQYTSGMEALARPLPPATWYALPAEAQEFILALQVQLVALQAAVAAICTVGGLNDYNSAGRAATPRPARRGE